MELDNNVNLIISGLLDIYNNVDFHYDSYDCSITKTIEIYNFKDIQLNKLAFYKNELSPTIINKMLNNLYGLSVISIKYNEILFKYCNKNIYMYFISDSDNIVVYFSFLFVNNNEDKKRKID